MRRHLAAFAALLALAACEGMTPPPSSAPARPAPLPEGRGRPRITLSNAAAAPGQAATVSVSLQTGGARIAGTQNDITFDPRAVAIVRKANGRPDCRANGELGKEGTAFNFLPRNCAPGACDRVRALVLSLGNVDPIPDGSVLYTCTVEVASGATPGAAPLRLSRVGFSDPGGKVVNGTGVDGTVTIDK